MHADEGFTTERVNPAYEDQMGTSAEQVRGQSLRENLGSETAFAGSSGAMRTTGLPE